MVTTTNVPHVFAEVANPCVNGRCLNLPTTMTFYCICDDGYSGRFCDEVEATSKYNIENAIQYTNKLI